MQKEKNFLKNKRRIKLKKVGQKSKTIKKCKNKSIRKKERTDIKKTKTKMKVEDKE